MGVAILQNLRIEGLSLKLYLVHEFGFSIITIRQLQMVV